MNDKAEPVREYLGPVATYLDNYKIEEMKVVRHVNSLWKANWKTGSEAFYKPIIYQLYILKLKQ